MQEMYPLNRKLIKGRLCMLDYFGTGKESRELVLRTVCYLISNHLIQYAAL